MSPSKPDFGQNTIKQLKAYLDFASYWQLTHAEILDDLRRTVEKGLIDHEPI